MMWWRRFLVVGLAWLGALGAARAAEMRASKPEVRNATVATIEGQLAAFRQGDVVKAYDFAAVALRAQKPLRVFAAIVRESYPEIWANTRAEYGIVRDDGAKATVTVQVYAASGEAAYDFTLVKETAGWRIHGVLRHEPKKAGKA